VQRSECDNGKYPGSCNLVSPAPYPCSLRQVLGNIDAQIGSLRAAVLILPNPIASVVDLVTYPCSLRQALGSIDTPVGRLHAAFKEIGGRSELNPIVCTCLPSSATLCSGSRLSCSIPFLRNLIFLNQLIIFLFPLSLG
jgi:hypothetical protein